MSNFSITNHQGSILTLAPLHDESGAVLVLHPKGHKNATKEVSAETAAHEIIARVLKAGWISLAPVGTLANVSEPVPAPLPPVAPVIVAPAPDPDLEPVLETASEVPAEPVLEAEAPVAPDPELPTKRSRK